LWRRSWRPSTRQASAIGLWADDARAKPT
jgi:hypothetical protein